MREAWCVLHDSTCKSKCAAWCVKVYLLKEPTSADLLCFFPQGNDTLFVYISVRWAKFRMTIKLNRRVCITYLYMKIKCWTHRWWIHETINHLVKYLKLDSESFHEYFRMTREQFGDILFQIEPNYELKVNRARETINAKATFCYRAYNYVWGGCPWITCIKWRHGRLAWCVLTAPRAVNTRAQNEYASRITHDVHVKSLFLFSMISVNPHHASRITLHASRVCGDVAYSESPYSSILTG